MKLSTRSRYGVRLMLELALHFEKGPLQLNIISESMEISEKYLGQIVIQLKNTGLINSVRGSQGGYLLARAPEKINLKEIVESLEGTICLVDCVEDKSACQRTNYCATMEVWEEITNKIKEILQNITLSDLALRAVEKKSVLNFSI
jgi:Rrf2 family protein